ncbi:hypothetical protein C8T65DRAFT_519713, partial [Cerioporus squamosus]
SLQLSKVAQMQSANHSRAADPSYQAGDLVMLPTFHRPRDYMQRGNNRLAK